MHQMYYAQFNSQYIKQYRVAYWSAACTFILNRFHILVGITKTHNPLTKI